MPRYPNRTPFERAVDGIITPEVDGDDLDIPVGRCATFVVAANDSSTLSKQQADYVCDGTADDVEIQLAIDALPANGGNLQLLEGIYNISTPIIINKHVDLIGAGVGATTIYLSAGSDCDMIQYDITSSTPNRQLMKLSGIELYGNLGNNAASTAAINNIGTDGPRDMLFENLWIESFNGHGIKIDHTHNVLCIHLSIERCNGASVEIISANVIIDACLLYDNWYGIHLNSADAILQVYGTRIAESSWEAIKIDICNYAIITNSLFLKNGTYAAAPSISIPVDNVIVSNNFFGSTVGETMTYCVQESGTANKNIIQNNIFHSFVTAALLIVGNNTKYTNKYTDLLMDVLAVSTTYIRSNEDLSAATPITFTLDAQPDVPRTLSWSFDTHAQITEYDMEVIGTDAKGNTVTETWDETTGWSGETSNAFATITSIKMTSRTGTGAADTMDIGITDVLGLSNIIYETSDVFKIKKNNANATVATAQVNTTYDTYDMSVIGLGAGDDFTIWYKSNLNIIS